MRSNPLCKSCNTRDHTTDCAGINKCKVMVEASKKMARSMFDSMVETIEELNIEKELKMNKRQINFTCRKFIEIIRKSMGM